MCLDIVFNGSNTIKEGYKIGRAFKLDDGRTVFSYMYGGTSFDKWVPMVTDRLVQNSCLHPIDGNPGFYDKRQNKKEYFPGFHIITNLEDAHRLFNMMKKSEFYMHYELFKCKYAGILAEGYESHNIAISDPIRVDVAAMIYIERDPVAHIDIEAFLYHRTKFTS